MIHIDIETYSEVDLMKHGVYRYAEHPSFEILMIAYGPTGGDVKVVVPGVDDTTQIKQLLLSDWVQKTAWNANFEIVCLSKWLGVQLDVKAWTCTMVDATRLGLPASLDRAGEVLKIDKLKDKEGKALIRYFSMPCKPTKVNEGRTRNLPSHDIEKWLAFKRYCKRDVEAEREIAEKIKGFKVSEFENKLWHLDQRINNNGMLLDVELVDGAVALDAKSFEDDTERAKRLTGLANPNSTSQLLQWFKDEGATIEDVKKETITNLLSHENPKVRQMAKLRLDLSKSSVKKYTRMKDMACDDGRVRGLLQFNGASRTGRWAGRGVQLQNLTKHRMSEELLDIARDTIRRQDFDAVDLIFKDSAQDILSQLVRTALIAPPGKSLFVSDFSAIEARVIAWYAKEQWRLDVFNSHGMIYEASASQMFKVPLDECTKATPEGANRRAKGKVAELALGYQGGAGALKAMGAEKMGMTEDEMKALVDSWRNANSKIVSFWYGLQQACVDCVETREPQTAYGLEISINRGFLQIELPSGRKLSYPKPRLRKNRWGGDVIVFKSLLGVSWSGEDTYGGKLVENVVQATARDILAESLIALDEAGYKIVGHVHDEVIIEADDDADIKDIETIMSRPIAWAKGLPLASDGFVSKFYMKD